jgi:hypothetical protein
VGLFPALSAVITRTRWRRAFADWGWRVPFRFRSFCS